MTISARVLPLLFGWILILVSTQIAAEPQAVLALVSERSAPTLVAGARQVLDSEADSPITIRTLLQLESLSESELQSLLLNHNRILFVAVFGDIVDRLLALSYPRNQRRYVIHSDRRLLALQNDRQGRVFAAGLPEAILNDREAVLNAEDLAAKQQAFPDYRDWLQTRAYWVNRSVDNAASLLRFVRQGGERVPPLRVVAPLRVGLHREAGADWLAPEALSKHLENNRAIVWLLDHDSADLSGEWELHRQYCAAVQAQCVSLLAGWGEPSVAAIRLIQSLQSVAPAQAIVSLQDFVVGGGEGRARVDELLADIGVPVLKGLRLADLSASDYALSSQGIPRDSVHYRVAMPELQGIGQGAILALASRSTLDERTGARVSHSEPIAEAIVRHARRAENWLRLQRKGNAEKRVAIVYYNHPPGRHNIGADNLNVPESLLEILRALQAQGYDTGPLPKDAEALLDRLQLQGVNLPNDHAVLAAMSDRVATLSADDYRKWFATLPASVRAEMTDGPLARLAVRLRDGVAESLQLDSLTERQQRLALLKEVLQNVSTDIHHALDGLRHPGRTRALALLEQLETTYAAILSRAAQGEVLKKPWSEAETLVNALVALNIEGLRGWGESPGKVMVWQDRLLVPGLRFGKVFIGPQPPRGWEIHEELLHANLSFPPPHQYLAFYHYLRDVFQADAMIHVGRHSTYEFLPRRSVGLGRDDYPVLIAGDVPGLYPYIVDGVGEGIQAKRRGQAVMIDHLTPPLAATELYDDLLELRQLIESAEAASDSSTRSRAVATLRQRIDEMNLREELVASMDEELAVRGVGFDDVDEEFLLHEVGHYLTNLQEAFMPLGLHVFGRDWSETSLATMLNSMSDGQANKEQLALWRDNLSRSPAAEMQALLAGLNGRFVEPGKGNDPIRTPEALPTGRNFYALDGSLLPTRVGYAQGSELASAVLQGESLNIEALVPGESNKQGIILWASDAVRDEGAMIAFGMKLLGVRPVWNSRGILKGLERIPLGDDQPRRLDVVFTTSGLFRDLYGEHLVLLDKASLFALDASADLIREQFPLLIPALDAALAALGEARKGGREPFRENLVAANWVDEARELLKAMPGDATAAGRQASLRVFGIAPGAYGAGVNRLAERSGAWSDRSELAEVFIKRMGHAYGGGLSGAAVQPLFRKQLAGISNTYLGRASNLYGLIDNNDAFDYLGGLNMAVEKVRGTRPDSAVINHANADRARIEPLKTALLGELRGRFLNPQWIKPLMDEGYAGARTMGSEFVEYLWGWQVTSPDIIRDEVWEAVKAVYVDDSHQLGLDDFLSEGHQRHVQTNMLAIMLVAIDKGFWEATQATRQQLAKQFADNVIASGLPGSGHTHPNHPVFDSVKPLLTEDQASALERVLERARTPPSGATSNELMRVAELQGPELQGSELQGSELQDAKQEGGAGESAAGGEASAVLLWLLAALATGLLSVGYWRGRRAL